MDLVPIIQAHVARCAITPSAARRQGAAGVVQAARSFLAQLDLQLFGNPNPGLFSKALEAETGRLGSSLPKLARSWGLSRKLLNIFLRDALYNRHLSAHYGLGSTEHLLELPLDSITGRWLREIAGRGRAPRLVRGQATDANGQRGIPGCGTWLCPGNRCGSGAPRRALVGETR